MYFSNKYLLKFVLCYFLKLVQVKCIVSQYTFLHYAAILNYALFLNKTIILNEKKQCKVVLSLSDF